MNRRKTKSHTNRSRVDKSRKMTSVRQTLRQSNHTNMNEIINDNRSSDEVEVKRSAIQINPMVPVTSQQVNTLSNIPEMSISVQPSGSNILSSNDIEIGSAKTVGNQSYLPLELAIDLVPQFNGESCTLFKFIKQSKLAYDLINPNNRQNLLILIRNKIIGLADNLILNRGDPDTLDGLISLLKNCFPRFFDVDYIFDELNRLKQEDGESIETYGARASEILSRGLEAAKEKYKVHEIIGVDIMLNSTAVSSFIRGLQNDKHGAEIRKEKPTTLSDAIDIALRCGIPMKAYDFKY